MRIAAVGDVHVGRDSAGWLRAELEGIGAVADLLLVAGDLTQHGTREEGELCAASLADLPVPVFSVLGNHEYHAGAESEIRAALEEAGVTVLEGETAVLEQDGVRLGIAGAKGFGGGFANACGTDFGEPEMKAFVRHGKEVAARFHDCLAALDTDIKVALTHYAPVNATLMGERREIYPFLGSYLLGEAIDLAGCDLAIHGHAHRGTEWGITPGGVPVRNVARPVIRHAYKVYRLRSRRAEPST